jgi:hypothetical protein
LAWTNERREGRGILFLKQMAHTDYGVEGNKDWLLLRRDIADSVEFMSKRPSRASGIAGTSRALPRPGRAKCARCSLDLGCRLKELVELIGIEPTTS